MKTKIIDALKWITDIFQQNGIPYMIGGGFAAHIYGSKRPVNDIDISLSGKYFPVIIGNVREYITAGPKHYSNEKWDCDTLSLNYRGQEIDITDVDTVGMSNKEQTIWFKSKEHFRKYPSMTAKVGGIEVSLMDPRDLLAYKRHLDGEHQDVDIAALEKYVEEGCLIPRNN